MRQFYRVILGKKSVSAPECFKGGFIGADFGISQDLTHDLPTEWREFNRKFIPIYMGLHPDKPKIGAGLACGCLWTVCKGINKGDIVFSPDGTGSYRVGEIDGEYYFAVAQPLPHRRRVKWFDRLVPKSTMSPDLQSSIGSGVPVINVTPHQAELERLLLSIQSLLTTAPSLDPDVVDPLAFAMEKHLEDFLVLNWAQTSLGKEYDIYSEDGELVGQQYATDAGPIDILAVSKDEKRILVIEMKRGRASDAVVGQILRYMGFVKEQIAEPHQTVEGIIIALDDDQKLRWAISATPGIEFYRYQIDFKLVKS